MREGLALLDEAHGRGHREELSPIVTGIVYCGVILACQEVYEVRRAREWTRALADWWALQPEMVAFTGRCLVHRAEILQLDGAWPDALEEARRAGERFVETKNPAAGLARYRQGELLRLQGEFAAAEEAYKEASALRLGAAARARSAAARAGTRGRCRGRDPPCGGGDHASRWSARGSFRRSSRSCSPSARSSQRAVACRELEELAGAYESAMLAALVAHARGRGASRRGRRAGRARRAARERGETWHALEAPYEIARTRVLVGEACRAARRRGGGDARARGGAGASSSASARSRISRGSRRSRRPTRHGLSRRELEVLRLVAVGEEQPRDRRRARHQRAHGRAARPEHLREARALLARCGDCLRLRARPRLSGARGQK